VIMNNLLSILKAMSDRNRNKCEKAENIIFVYGQLMPKPNGGRLGKPFEKRYD